MTFSEFNFHGEDALKAIIAQTPYKTLAQAVASLTLFTHPEIVKHTKNQGLFRIRKFKPPERRGDEIKNEKVIVCDNQSPTLAFLWSNGLQGANKPREVQYNHIYPLSQDRLRFTSLANICVTPAFLAKLTDTNEEVINLLRYHASKIYGNFCPPGFAKPYEPEGYHKLEWAPYPCGPCGREEFIEKIETKIRQRLQSRIGICAQHFGWLLNKKPLHP